MYEEIDIRPYLKILWENWFWLIGSAISLTIFAFIGTRFIPPLYEATTLLFIEENEDIIQFDERIRSEESLQFLGAYQELATSDAVLFQLLNKINLNNVSFTQFEKQLDARLGSDPRLIQLTVENENPERAAEIANAWAEEFINWTNLLYGTHSGESLGFYESELADSEVELRSAESALIEFQSVNRTPVISNTLQTLYQTQSDYLANLDEINQVAEDIASMQHFLEENPTNATATFADQFTLLSLQTRLFNANEQTVLLQLTQDDELSLSSRNDQSRLLISLAEVATTQTLATEQKLAQLEPQILDLQQQLQESLTEHQRLLRNHLIAEENYLSLARKTAEDRIVAQNETPPIRLISEAAVPDKPTNNHTFSAVAIAFLLGFSLSAAIILAFHWWRKEAS